MAGLAAAGPGAAAAGFFGAMAGPGAAAAGFLAAGLAGMGAGAAAWQVCTSPVAFHITSYRQLTSETLSTALL